MAITPVPTKARSTSLSSDEWNALVTSTDLLITASTASAATDAATATQIAGLQSGVSSINAALGARIAALEAANTANVASIASIVTINASQGNRLTALENVALPAVPNPVTNVHTTAMTTTTAAVAWTAPVSGSAPTDYLVEWSLQGSNIWSSTGAGLVGGTGVTMTVTGLTASTASVTKLYIFRVTAKDAAGPGAPVVSAAASATSIASGASPDKTDLVAPTAALITDASANTWGITSSQVVVNGTPDATTNGVVELAYVSGLIWQKNLSSDWYSKSSPGATWSGPTKTNPITGVAGPTIPQQAINAGYSVPVLFEDFTSASAVSSVPGAIASFYTRNPYGQQSLTSADYTIANSLLTFSKDLSGFGWGLGTTNAPAGSVPISTPTSHAVNTGNGVGYQYGYYEFRLAFDRSKLASNIWWPAVWMTGDIFGGNYIELDVAEWDSTPNGNPYSSVHDWNSPAQSGIRSPIFADNPDISNVSFATPTTFNRFGMLWTPTGVTFYWNDQPGPTVPTTTTLSMEHNGTAIGSGILQSANTSHVQVVIGTGNGIPLSIDYVLICQ